MVLVLRLDQKEKEKEKEKEIYPQELLWKNATLFSSNTLISKGINCQLIILYIFIRFVQRSYTKSNLSILFH